MAWQTSALVIANRTVDSDQLLEALARRSKSGPVKFTLLVPCGPTGRDGARERLEAACTRMREAGLGVEGALARDSGHRAPAHAGGGGPRGARQGAAGRSSRGVGSGEVRRDRRLHAADGRVEVATGRPPAPA